MKIKKAIVFFELILVCFLSGCSGGFGLDEQLIVYGIAVDKNEDLYELTLQALNTQNTSNSDSKEDKKSVITVSAKAKTLIDTINLIENQTGKKVLYSHAMALIIGEETAKNSGINDIITFFSTNHKLRPTVEVLISNSFAKEIFLSEKNDKTINAEDIFSITNVENGSNDAINSNVRYLLSDINNELKAAKVWYLEYDKEAGAIKCQKIALFKTNKLIDILDEDISKGARLVYGKAKNISDSLTINDILISYKINSAKSNINVKIADNRPIFSIATKVNLELYNSVSDSSNDELKEILKKRLTKLIINTLNFCIKEKNCDIFNFHRYIMNSDTTFFKNNQLIINDLVKSADYIIDVDTKIKYMGTSNEIKVEDFSY